MASINAVSSHRPSGRDLDSLEKARPRTNIGGERQSLRVAIVTENFLPKIDGVTRTLAMLLEHLQAEGHEALVLGPSTPLTSYAGAEVVSTKGIPLLGVYRGLGLNFIRPRFISKLRAFDADVIMFVDPIWLCAQTIPAVQYYFPNTPLLSSYHTNLATYATLFGFAWLTPVMWGLQRNLHGRCDLTFCPSPSTSRMLGDHGFTNVRLWPRGVDIDLFRPSARDFALRQAWGVEPLDLDEDRPSPRLLATEPRVSISSDDVPALALPPPYTPQPASAFAGISPSKLAILYVGRVSWEKNLRLLIDAFRGLQHPDSATGRPACQLIFVGDGPARAEVESLCESYGLGARFLGFKKGEELAAAYASSDIFAFPSFTETFGQVVSEAQASGLPVVGLRAEGVSDLVEHGKTGLLLDLNDLSTDPAPCLSAPPTYSAATTPPSSIPPDPHALLSPSSATYPIAVTRYRQLLVSIATQHAYRQAMGSAAHLVASKRSWWRAMEDLCDGFRELAAVKAARIEAKVGAATLYDRQVDMMCKRGSDDNATKVELARASSHASSGRRRLLRVVSSRGESARTSSSMMLPIRNWLASSSSTSTATRRKDVRTPSLRYERSVLLDGGPESVTDHSPGTFTVLLVQALIFFTLISLIVSWSSHLELLSFLRT